MIVNLILQFLLAILLVHLYYKLVEARNVKKFTKKNLPVDLKVFIKLEKVNIKKISYNKLFKLVVWINAIDVGIAMLLTNLTDKLILKILIAIPAVVILIYLSYTLVGYILKKKGLTINES